MKTPIILLLGLFLSISVAEEVVEEKITQSETKKDAPICFGTILSRHREIYFGFCFETDTVASIMEHSNKSRGRKSPYRCWSEGVYQKDHNTNNIEFKISEGECNKNKKLKSSSLICKPNDENGYLCEFDYRKGKEFLFSKAMKRKVVDAELCKNNKEYLSINRIACKTHFGMKSGVNLKNQNNLRNRMPAESRHGTQ